MTAADLVAVLIGTVTLAVAAATAAVLVWLVGVVRDLRATLSAIRGDLVPAVDELQQAARDAAGDVERIERMLEQSELVADRVDTASRLAYSAFSRPVVKAMAVGAGTKEAVRKLRGRPQAERSAGDDRRPTEVAR
jgi:hypothetical protein